MSNPETLIPFYFDGREAKLVRIRKLCADPEQIAEQIRKGSRLRTAITDATKKARDLLAEDPRYRKRWIDDNEDALDGVSSMAAFGSFMDGLADELAYSLEDEVLPLIAPDEGDEEDGDEEGEEEGDESDGDDK